MLIGNELPIILPFTQACVNIIYFRYSKMQKRWKRSLWCAIAIHVDNLNCAEKTALHDLQQTQVACWYNDNS